MKLQKTLVAGMGKQKQSSAVTTVKVQS